uniref:18S rRNA biogenesis protein n=1 Tax=Corythucha ciliata TaxID=369451 RepID=A0A2S0M1E9_CORCT|nr:18S rRNA biogenesis protein [Corythucha ciliata]
MPDGILDVIRGFIDYESDLSRVSYKDSIFIFLSNMARGPINQETLNMWKKGTKREDFSLFPFQKLISEATYDEEGGLKTSSLIASSLIDVYVPFLPLEKEHVEMCIRSEIRRLFGGCVRNSEEKIIKDLSEKIDYEPDDLNLYAVHGCKNLDTKVIMLERMYRCFGDKHHEL